MSETLSPRGEIETMEPSEPKINHEEWSILLNITAEKLRDSSTTNYAEEHGMVPKPEYHLTLLGRGTGSKLIETLGEIPEPEKQAKFDQLVELLKEIDWSFVLKPKKLHITKHYDLPATETWPTVKEDRESILQPIEMPGIKKFYDKLNEIFGSNVPLPYPHVTLFSKSSNPDSMSAGIGVYTEKDLDNLNPKEI